MGVSFQDMYKMSSAASENAYQGSQNVTIEKILSEARNSGDPRVMQQSIDKILSKVHPSRQPQAVQVINGMINNIAAKEAGLTPGLDPNLQKMQLQHNQQMEMFSNAKNINWDELDENEASALLSNPALAAAAKNRLDNIKEEKKLANDKTNKLAPLYAANYIVDEIESIIKKNPWAVGVGSSYYNNFSSAREARQEIVTLGNSLLQVALPFAIRNEKEFETAKKSLTDPNSTLASNIGAIKGLRKIINNNIKSITRQESQSEGFSDNEAGVSQEKETVDQETVNKIFR